MPDQNSAPDQDSVPDPTSVPAGEPSADALPLTLLDEGLLHLQDARTQWNVQFELGADHQLDEARVRQAVLSCCHRHPLARARIAPWKQSDNSYRWDIVDEPELDPLRVADCPDDAALDDLRAEFYQAPIDLGAAPGFRLVLARRPGGDLLLMSASHLVADGVGGLRLIQTMTREYRGEPDPPDPLPLAQARDLGSVLAPKTRNERWARRWEALRQVREAIDAPSRIAVAGGLPDDDGFGFGCRALDLADVTAAAPERRQAGATVNDVLLAALHLTVQDWNTAHGVRTDRVGIMMPVNIRPADRFWEVVSNLTSMVSVSTVADDRKDLATATAAVAAQTTQVRREDRAHGLYDMLDLTKKAPLVVKRAAPRLLPHTGDRFVDTAMLSNLGRIPEPPTFTTDSAAPELRFSPPCDQSCSVAIGIATSGRQLTLVTRYRREQFDAHAAAEFTDLLLTHLDGY